MLTYPNDFHASLSLFQRDCRIFSVQQEYSDIIWLFQYIKEKWSHYRFFSILLLKYLSTEQSLPKPRNSYFTFHLVKHLKYMKIGHTDFTQNIIGMLGTEEYLHSLFSNGIKI